MQYHSYLYTEKQLGLAVITDLQSYHTEGEEKKGAESIFNIITVHEKRPCLSVQLLCIEDLGFTRIIISELVIHR